MQTIGIERNSKSTQVRRKKSNEPSAKELDVILYLQGRFPHINFREGQKPQQNIIDLPNNGIVKVNDSNIFVISAGEIRVFNRWSLTPVTCYETTVKVRDVHVNNRVVVIEKWNSQEILVVLDAETLKTIQLIDPTPTSEEIDQGLNNSRCKRYCYLYRDLLYHISIFKDRNLAIIKTHQLKKSSCHFETIQERKIEFT